MITIRIEPQPLSRTDKGGNKIANKTLQMLIIIDKDKSKRKKSAPLLKERKLPPKTN